MLRNLHAYIEIKWAEYKELFGTSPRRIELLNSAAGLFFRILQDTLWEDALLHLCRLTDPAKMHGKENLFEVDDIKARIPGIELRRFTA